MTRTKRGACPSCGSKHTAPIGYGYPSAGMMDAAERGEIALGGCCVSDNDPKHRCKECGREWGRPRVELTSRFEAAVALAVRLHHDQLRKGTSIPYASHLLGAASLVLENGGDEDDAIAALLHDAVEDCEGPETRDLIARKFGEHVARVVEACSDTDVMPKPPWRVRKEHHLASLQGAPRSVLLVTAADKVHNLRSVAADARVVGDAIFGRFNGGREGTLWYYGQMVELLEASELAGTSIVRELRAAVQDLDRILIRTETDA